MFLAGAIAASTVAASTVVPANAAPAGLAPSVSGVGLAAGERSSSVVHTQAGIDKSKAGRKHVIDGIKAFEGNRLDRAISSLTKALDTGALGKEDLAKALYFRGQAYQKAGRPAEAIADLNSALWLNSGLNDGERQKAESLKVAAYRSAGLASGSQGSPASAGGAASVAASQPATARGSGSTSSGAGLGSGLGSLFGGLFGGNSSSSNSASTSAPATSAPASPRAATSGWNSEVVRQTGSLRNGADAGSSRTAAVTAPAPTRPASAPKGRYVLQVTAVRSRGEAEAVVAELRSRYGAQMGSGRPSIDETVLGNMGTFYRVKVGPYAGKAEPNGLCNALRSSGFDCLLTSQ